MRLKVLAYKIFCHKLTIVTYPLFRVFGTKKGKMPPTMPQKAVKIKTGIQEAPILDLSGSRNTQTFEMNYFDRTK
jgi:hypothetical protein